MAVWWGVIQVNPAAELEKPSIPKPKTRFLTYEEFEALAAPLIEVTEEDIAQVVALWTGIPVTRIAQEESVEGGQAAPEEPAFDDAEQSRDGDAVGGGDEDQHQLTQQPGKEGVLDQLDGFAFPPIRQVEGEQDE